MNKKEIFTGEESGSAHTDSDTPKIPKFQIVKNICDYHTMVWPFGSLEFRNFGCRNYVPGKTCNFGKSSEIGYPQIGAPVQISNKVGYMPTQFVRYSEHPAQISNSVGICLRNLYRYNCTIQMARILRGYNCTVNCTVLHRLLTYCNCTTVGRYNCMIQLYQFLWRRPRERWKKLKGQILWGLTIRIFGSLGFPIRWKPTLSFKTDSREVCKQLIPGRYN